MACSVQNVTFNQDRSLFSVSTNDGLKVFSAEPLLQKCCVDGIGSIGKTAMLNCTNLLAIISGENNPRFSNNVVQIWDDRTKSFVMKYVFPEKVLNVKMSEDKIFMVFKTKVYVYTFPNNSQLLFQVDTSANPLGLCQFCPTLTKHLLVVLGQVIGSLQLIHLPKVGINKSRCPSTIRAHKTGLACMTINDQGTIIATASKKGTLIRLFDTQKHQKIAELRRGSGQALIHCINFNKDSSLLCAVSDTGTVHIFAIKDVILNYHSAFAVVGIVVPFQQYTSSLWSFCNFAVSSDSCCVCAFGSKQSVIAVCADGTFHKYVFTTRGACVREGYGVFLKLGDKKDF
ncbi:unnamed protein product [Clavelina lepadiformis]|uniref:WD repeat domain phosphoinositide-interacting protein 3 n=1 Tax=Clavelina lepadiformis TaxID=159417 RepID=A0ABP0FNP7_CLALP